MLSLSFFGFSQKDSLDYSLKSWRVNSFLEESACKQDTFLEDFQLYNPMHRRGYAYAFLGNTGQPYQNTFYANRKTHSFIFLTPYYDYLFVPRNASFYNTKQPYTNFTYVTNFSKNNNLQNVDLIHTQNVLPNLNFGVQYRLLGALGEYQSQKTSNHFLRFFSSYQGKHYQAFALYHYNKINSFLNGGIQSDTLLHSNYEISDPKIVPVNLTKSKNAILNRNINLKQSYSFGERIAITEGTEQTPVSLMRWRIGHELDWNYNKRIYTNEGEIDFYQTFYIDTASIKAGKEISDSTAYWNVNNSVFLQLLDDTLSKELPSFVLGYRLSKNFYHSYKSDIKDHRHWVYFKVFNPVFDRWYWSLSGDYDLSVSDIKSKAQLRFFWDKNQSINFSSQYTELNPDVFYTDYYSHFYSWKFDDFKKTKQTNFELYYRNKALKLTFGVQQNYFENFVYIGSRMGTAWESDTTTAYERIYGIPMQQKGRFGIFSVYAQHKLDWGAFHMKNAIAYQHISNDNALHIPQIQWYNSTYFQMQIFRRVMTLQIGFDLRYNSSYYADGFMPATGLFYVQNEREMGSYPYFDLFINAKVKRVRIFFKLEHLNKGLNGNGYYTALHYPMNDRVFRFGLSWRFYN